MLKPFRRRHSWSIVAGTRTGTLRVRGHRIPVPLCHRAALLSGSVLCDLGLLDKLLAMLVHVVMHVLRRHSLERILKPNFISVVWIRNLFFRPRIHNPDLRIRAGLGIQEAN